MVLLSSLLVAMVAAGGQTDATLSSRLFPNPTGKNGYEDYIRAADMVNGASWDSYDMWLGYLYRKRSGVTPEDNIAPPIPVNVSYDMADLEVRKVMDDQFSGALEPLSSGNAKSISTPHRETNGPGVLPELQAFRLLVKINANHAHVEFAEGRASLAVKDLLEGLRFSTNVCGNSRLTRLSSIGSQGVEIRELAQHLGQLSYDDARDIDKACRDFLGRPLDWTAVLQTEYAQAGASLDEVLRKPETQFTDASDQPTRQALSGLSDADRQNIKGLVSNGLQDSMDEELQRLSGPESQWIIRSSIHSSPKSTDFSAVGLTKALVEALEGRELKENFIAAVERGRAKIRLLLLSAKLLEYQWLHNRLPAELKDFATAEEAFDPLANGPFHYEVKDGAYQIYSDGSRKTGRLDLLHGYQGPGQSRSGDGAPR